MQVTTILKKLEQYYIAQKSIAYTLLQDGLSQTEIDQKIAPIGLTFPPEVYELFQWKNGHNDHITSKLDHKLLFEGGIFESLDALLEEYKIRHGRGEWAAKYFPLFTNGGGDYMLVNCEKGDLEYGYIYYHSVPLFGRKILLTYTSLHNHLEGVAECFDAHAYWFENGVLEVDYEKEAPILEKYEIPNQEEDDDF